MIQNIENIFLVKTDRSFQVTSINQEWEKHFSEDFISIKKDFNLYLSASDRENLKTQINQAIQDGKAGIQLEFPLMGENNVLNWFHWIISIEDKAFVFNAIDISKWKFAENQMKATETYLDMGAWAVNLSDMSTQWSEKTYKIHGEKPDQKTDVKKGIEYFLPEYRQMIEEKLTKAIENSMPFEFEARIEKIDGEVRWVKSYGLCEKFNDHTASVFGLIEDIHKSKQDKTDLKVSKEQLESVAQNLPGILYTFFMQPDGQFGYSYMTKKAEDIYGFRAEELIANPALTFETIHPNDREDLNRAISDSKKNMTEFQWMGRVLKNGKTKWIKAVSTPYKKPDGTIEWRGIMLDVTNEKEREELIEVQQSQLFASRQFSDLGEVAGGIAHEINTPLATLGLSIDLIENLHNRNELDETKLAETLDSMRKVVNRLARIVETIRNFSRNKVGEPMVRTNWLEICQEALDLVNEKIKQKEIEIEFDIDESLIVNCRYNQTLQAFLNLIKNAIDAIEKEKQNPKKIKIQTRIDKENIFLEVIDSGPGVPVKIKDRIFDSFFTTKAYGRGTGLGLSLSREFIEASGGQLELIKYNKRYNCFRISFPNLSFKEVC